MPRSASKRGISDESRELRIAPKTATPTAPPIERKNVADEVAMPRSRRSTVFCTARISVCIVKPSPAPNTTIATDAYTMLVSEYSRDSNSAPRPISGSPISGNTFHRPHFVTARPVRNDTTSIPTTSGNVSSPDIVGLWPRTTCRYCGR